jgi:hypothetical protein
MRHKHALHVTAGITTSYAFLATWARARPQCLPTARDGCTVASLVPNAVRLISQVIATSARCVPLRTASRASRRVCLNQRTAGHIEWNTTCSRWCLHRQSRTYPLPVQALPLPCRRRPASDSELPRARLPLTPQYIPRRGPRPAQRRP